MTTHNEIKLRNNPEGDMQMINMTKEKRSKPHFLINYAMLKRGRAVLLMIAWTWISPSVTAQFGGGSGTETDPYQIKTITHLDSIRRHSGGVNYLNKHFVLMNDLDFDSYAYAKKGWVPIAQDKNDNDSVFSGTKFTGSFHGQGYAIRNLFINRTSRDYVGLFGALGGSAKIDSLGMDSVNITGRNYVGGMAGMIDFTAKISHSYATGQIKGRNSVGGLAGQATENAIVEETYTAARIFGSNDIGGLIGKNLGRVSNNYTSSRAEGNEDVGGLIGINEGTVMTCYASTRVGGGTNAGGLIGSDNSGTYFNNYWNMTITELSHGVGNGDNDGVTPLTTEEMHEPANLVGFRYGNNQPWRAPNANRFPQLRKLPKNAQAIDFPPLMPIKPDSDPFTLTYTLIPPAPAGVSVSFESSDETVATINNNGKVTLQGKVGATNIIIHRTGNDDYVPLVSVSRKLVVHPFEGGTGTEADPYQIATTAQLDAIRNNGDENFLDNHYALTADLDFDTYEYADEGGWQPIGHDTNNKTNDHRGTAFTGSFNGRGFTIRNMRINRPEQNYVGLFGHLNGSLVKIDSLGVENTEVIGNNHVGGIVGSISFGTISNSYAAGKVQGVNYVGGLFGASSLTTTKASYTAVQVEGNEHVGGLGGQGRGMISNTYATGAARGVKNVGGLIGNKPGGTIENSYAVGRVQGSSDVGGLVGKMELPTTFTANYWNEETTGQVNSDGGTGLTTVEMYADASFMNWDWVNTWIPPMDGKHFPLLKGVTKNAQVLDFVPMALKKPNDETFPLDYSLWPSTLDGMNTTLESANEVVATIDASGEVTINKMGIAMLTISRTGNDDYVSVSVSRVLVVNPFEKGTGTKTDPYEVNTPAQLDFIRDYGGYGSGDLNLLDDHYVLMKSIDFSGYEYEDPDKGWQPIGHDPKNGSITFEGTPFTGSFNGQGHRIHHLRANRPDQDYVGLFGNVESDFKIDSLGVEEVEMTGDGAVGGLVGHMVNGDITNSYAIGSMKGRETVGGLIGYIDAGTNDGMISHSYAIARITANGNGIGGLVARINAEGYTIQYSYANSQIMGGNEDVGGLIGWCLVDSIYNAYALGRIIGDDNVGGLIGQARNIKFIGNTYAAVKVERHAASGGIPVVGGLIGKHNTAILAANNYWNTDISERVMSAAEAPGKVAPLTTAEMYVQSHFSGYDFANIWFPPENEKYFPLLRGVGNRQFVSITADETSITEADNEATFTLTRTGVTIPPLSVRLSITEHGTFLDDSAPSSVMFAAGATTAPLTVPITNDDIDEADGILTVALEENFSYTLVEDAKEATVSITDDDPPKVNIAAKATAVIEGEDVEFTLTREGQTTGTLTVNVGVEDPGNYIDGTTPTTLDFEDGETTATLTIATMDDAIDEPSGLIMATVEPGTGYTVDDISTAEVGIIDNDGVADPEVTIAVASSPVTEGVNAVFTLTRTTTSGALTVNVEITQQGDYIDETTPATLDFENGEATATLTIATMDDAIDEPNGTITATVRQGTGYAVSNPSVAKVDVIDDDGVADPEVSMAAAMNAITEGEDMIFTLTRKGQNTANLTVNVEVIQQGNFISSKAPTTVTFADRSATATLTITTEDDDIDEPNGTITATVRQGTGYAVSNPSVAKVDVIDDDGVADPEVSMAAAMNAITEGEDMIFTLTRKGQNTANLTVNVEITQQGDYIDETTPTTVVFAEGEATATLTITTEDDDIDEPNGTITATVKHGTAYIVGNPSSVEVDVIDNDEATVSITAATHSVIEGADANFTLTRKGQTTGTLIVEVEVTEQGDYIIGKTPNTVVFENQKATATLTVTTEDDDIDEPNGTITATIKHGIAYVVGDPYTAEIDIANNDETIETDETGIAIYPNPVTEQLYILLSQEGRMTIYTLSGRQERNYHIQPEQEPITIDVSKWSSGIYVIMFTDNTGQSTYHRIIKR